MKQSSIGTVVRVAGPVVVVQGLTGVRMYDVVHVGHLQLVGEVIRLSGSLATVQVYEDTGGLRVGEPAVPSGGPFMVELGPGILGAIFDGIERPLVALRERQGDFIARGGVAPALDRQKAWQFQPQVQIGARLVGGDVLGAVQETEHLEHRIMVPPGLSGVVEEIHSGWFTVEEVVAVLRQDGRLHRLSMMQRWPARRPRPHRGKFPPVEPLLTGQRVVDTFYPIAKGGTAIIPGGFGTGKTVLEQTLAKWADADVVVYVGCGERGNEMTEVLEEFPKLEDPHTKGALMDRTVLIANTSNMPVVAREASIYTAVTIAEYLRDMGYDVALMADSTSRWGEALREVSGRMEEMPGEEGFPAYLLSRLAEFYERAGRVCCSGSSERTGSVTLIGAVSPPGGDFSEPITQNSLRVTGTFWGLDTDLARRRHFPAINWTSSYSLYALGEWFNARVSQEWTEQSQQARAVLQRERELQEIVQLVGADAIAENEKGELVVGRMLREDFLQQSAVGDDAYCPLQKTYWMLRVILAFRRQMVTSLKEGIPLDRVAVPELLEQIARMREWKPQEVSNRAPELLGQLEAAFRALGSDGVIHDRGGEAL
jgi:V/A-type H+/Na+-transporting ATPase subunit A